jgi:hypothetical protein
VDSNLTSERDRKEDLQKRHALATNEERRAHKK